MARAAWRPVQFFADDVKRSWLTLQTMLARVVDQLSAMPRSEVRTVTASGNITEGDAVLWVDTTGGAITLQPPAAAIMRGHIFSIQRIAGAAAVTFDPNGAELVNGGATLSITTPIRLTSDGAAWRTI